MKQPLTPLLIVFALAAGITLADSAAESAGLRRDLEALVEHMAEDSLVGWAWTPGAGRQPAPGTWESFGELIRAWAKTGAACPGDAGAE